MNITSEHQPGFDEKDNPKKRKKEVPTHVFFSEDNYDRPKSPKRIKGLFNFIYNHIYNCSADTAADAEMEYERDSAKIEMVKEKQPKLQGNEENTVFVSNLASDTIQNHLHELFSQVILVFLFTMTLCL